MRAASCAGSDHYRVSIDVHFGEIHERRTTPPPTPPPAPDPPPVSKTVNHAVASSPSWLAGMRRPAVAGAIIGAALAAGAFLLPQVGGPIEGPTDHTAYCDAQNERVQRAAYEPFGEDARALAAEALDIRAAPRADHPYLAYRAEIRSRLERLGLIVRSGDHVHVSDVDLEHGGAVIRSALGLYPLTTVSSTMSVGDAPEEAARVHLRPEQYVRLAPIFLERASNGMGPGRRGDTFEQLLSDAMVEHEYSILEVKLRLAILREQRDQLPPEARIFVNMSFGTSGDRMAAGIAMQMLTAPPDSELYALAARVLGEAPSPEAAMMGAGGPQSASPCGGASRLRPNLPRRSGTEMSPEEAKLVSQIERLKRDLIFPQLKARTATPAMRAILRTARADLEGEVAASRRAGILVFEAAGNEHSDARAAGDPAMSASTTDGVRGIIRVGALDQVNPHDLRDDRVADFSAAGTVTVAARGVGLPVWLAGRTIEDSDGTSFSSPVVLETAASAAALDPRAPVDRVAAWLVDRRVAIDVPGTTRDGAGVPHPFAIMLVAANPRITPAQIDRAWRELADPRADVIALRRELGLVRPDQNLLP